MRAGGDAISRSSGSKAQPAVGILLSCLDVLLIVGLLTFAAPCSHLDGTATPSCVWAMRAVLGVAAVIGILAIVRVFERDEGERRGLSLGCALLGVLVATMPGLIVGFCPDPTMPCNAIMHPFVVAVGVAIALVGGIDLVRRLLALRG